MYGKALVTGISFLGVPLGILEGAHILGTLKKRLWRRASLSIGALLRKLEGAHLPGTLRDG